MKKNVNGNRILASLLAVVLAVGMMPSLAFGWTLEAGSSAGAGVPDDRGDSSAHLQASDEGTTFAADYADGARGTEENPYRITTEQDLYELAKVVNGREPSNGRWVETGVAADSLAGKFVRLENDIELTGPATPIGIGSNNALMADSAPIGFAGTFDGGGHVIEGWHSSAAANPEYGNTATSRHAANAFGAPFGAIAGATIHDLGVSLKSDTALGAYSAGLVACVASGANVIERCSVEGDVSTAAGNVGGIVAAYYGSSLAVRQCYHAGSVSAADRPVGGLVGYINAAGLTLARCYQFGEVTSAYEGTQYYPATYAWGLMVGSGGTYRVTIDSCATDQEGQLCPANASRVSASGCLTGVSNWQGDDVKAALGEDAFDFSDEATASGTRPPAFAAYVERYSVTFDASAQGATGAVPSVDPQQAGATFAIPDATLTRPGFDFAGWRASYENSADDTVYAAGDTFAMPASPVTFTAEWVAWEPQVISTEAQLRQLATDVNEGTVSTEGRTYRLANDIKLVRGGFTPIGKYQHPFKGTFDGAGHVISGLLVEDGDAVPITGSTNKGAGLFGLVSSAVICDLGVEGEVHASTARYAGALVASASGTKAEPARIERCFARASVEGGGTSDGYVGGLLGSMIFSSVENCYAVGSVTTESASSNARVGGLVGSVSPGASRVLADGEMLVSHCYAACSVSAPEGGAGKVSALVGCAYDTAFTEDGGWTRLGDSYVLECAQPIYWAYSQSEQYAAQCPNALKVTLMLTADELAVAGPAKLGSAFKADSAYADFQVNGGFPVLAWQDVPAAAYAIEYVLGPASWKADASPITSYEIGSGAVLLPGVDALAFNEDDYLFLGWYDNAAYEGSPVTVVPAGSTGVKTFFASWRHRSALRNDLIEQARAVTVDEGVQVSAAGDGSDVPEGAMWVSRETMDALVAAREAVAGLPANATVAQVEAARAALEDALAGFVPAPGTKPADDPGQGGQGGQGGGQAPSGSDGSDGSGGAPGSSTAGGSGSGAGAKPTSIANATLRLSAKKFTYNGKAKKPAVVVTCAGKRLAAGTDYTVSYAKNVNAGKASVKVVARGSYTGVRTATFTIAKAKNPFSAKAKKKTLTVKASNLKKGNVTIKKSKAFKVGKAKGTVTFKKKSGNKKITVFKKGKITCKKGLKKGTYKVKVRVKAKGTKNYKAKSKTVALKIKVK